MFHNLSYLGADNLGLRTMKREERIASDFLKRRFGQEPLYEPLGRGTPPDFSIDQAAFEVRRLNQRYFHEDGSNEGLEQVEQRLNRALHEALLEIPFADEGGSFYWGLKFQRPLTDRPRNIAKRLARAALSYYSEGRRSRKQIVSDDVTIDLIPASGPKGKAFLSGYTSDNDSGGWLQDTYPVSIRLALEEKITKTKKIADNFNPWILVLIDDIFGLTNGNDIDLLDLKLEHFNSVVVLNQEGNVALEWPEGSLNLTLRSK